MSKSLREALSDATSVLEDILDAFSRGEGGVYKSDVAEVIDAARAALAAPRRNCDVGTPEERMMRYHALRREITERHERIGEHNPPSYAYPTAFEWEDRPYEEKGSEG